MKFIKLCILVLCILQVDSFQNRFAVLPSILSISSSSIPLSSISSSSSIPSASPSSSLSDHYVYCKPNENDLQVISKLISANFDGPFDDNNIIDKLKKKYSEFDNLKKLEYRFNNLLNAKENEFKMQPHSMIVAKDKSNSNEVIGFIEMGMVVSSERLKKELESINIQCKQLPHIGNLVINEQYRRRGIASRLMNEILQEINLWEIYAPIVLVAVEPKNLAAKSLYEKSGFDVLLYEHRVLFSYELNRDRIILKKDRLQQ